MGKTEQKRGVFVQLSDANARAVGSEEAAAVREMPLFCFVSLLSRSVRAVREEEDHFAKTGSGRMCEETL
jgi:hypothetical protein